MPKTVLITGASNGIGLELAELFAADKYNLVIVARNLEKLQNTAAKFSDKYKINVEIISRDLTDRNSPQKIYEELKQKGMTIDVLVNNAGFGLYGKFADTNLNRELEMIQINNTAVVEMTKLFLPELIKNKGKILNIGSTASFGPGPGMAIYYATKAFILSFSQAIAEELKSKVSVTVLCPGPTKTDFEKTSGLVFPKLLAVMDAKTVAKIGYQALIKNKRVIVPGFRNKMLPFLMRFFPRIAVTKVTDWIQNGQTR